MRVCSPDRFAKIAGMSGGGNGSSAAAGSFGNQMYNAVANFRDHRQLTINSEDVVRSMQVDPASACGGDF